MKRLKKGYRNPTGFRRWVKDPVLAIENLKEIYNQKR